MPRTPTWRIQKHVSYKRMSLLPKITFSLISSGTGRRNSLRRLLWSLTIPERRIWKKALRGAQRESCLRKEGRPAHHAGGLVEKIWGDAWTCIEACKKGVPRGQARDSELGSRLSVHKPGIQRVPRGEPCTPEHGWPEPPSEAISTTTTLSDAIQQSEM